MMFRKIRPLPALAAMAAATVKGGISDSFAWVSFEAGVKGDGAVDRTGAGPETEATSLV